MCICKDRTSSTPLTVLRSSSMDVASIHSLRLLEQHTIGWYSWSYAVEGEHFNGRKREVLEEFRSGLAEG